jgi:hypothetical protein
MIWFFRVTVSSGSLANMACRNMARAVARRLAGFEIALAENSNRLADSEICLLFQ